MTRAGSSALGGGAQLAEQRDGEVKDALDVRVQDLLPAGGGELLQRRAPHGAGVVDEDVERGEALARGAAASAWAPSVWICLRGSRGSHRAR